MSRWAKLRAAARARKLPRDESLQHLGLPPQSQEQQSTAAAMPAAAAAAPLAAVASSTSRDADRGQTTPRDAAAPGGGDQVPFPDDGVERLINFKLESPASSGSTPSGTSYQLKSMVSDLPEKLQLLLESRIWQPSGSKRPLEIGDLVLVRDTDATRKVGKTFGRVIGKLGRIIRDDKDSTPYRLKIMGDPFAFQTQSDVGPLKPTDLTLVDVSENVPSFSLVGRNSHPVAAVYLDEAFWQACNKLNSDLQAAQGDRQRFKAQEDLLQSVAVVSTHWMPFDPGAFTPEGGEADAEVVAVGTELVRALDTDVAVFPPKGLSAVTSLSVPEADLQKAIQTKLGVVTPKLEQAQATVKQQSEKARELQESQGTGIEAMEREVLAMRGKIEKDLAAAEPELVQALAALDSLNVKDLGELKSLKKPPGGVDDVTAAVICLLQTKDAPFKKIDTSWKAAQQMMSPPPKFLEVMRGFKQKIDDGLVPKSNFRNIQDLLKLEHFDPEVMRSKSNAAACLADFVININVYNTINEDVEPKRQMALRATNQLEQATNARRVAVATLAKAKEDVEAMAEQVKRLTVTDQKNLAVALLFKRCLVCRADAIVKFAHPYVAPIGVQISLTPEERRERLATAKKREAEVQQIKDKLAAEAMELAREKDAVERDLEAAKPMLAEAENALKALTANLAQIGQLRSLKSPPNLAKRVLDACLILCMKDVVPTKAVSVSLGRGDELLLESSWKSSTAMMSEKTFLNGLLRRLPAGKLSDYAKQMVNEETLELLYPYLSAVDFTSNDARRVATAAAGLVTWVRAEVSYVDVAKVQKPKVEQLRAAQATQKRATVALEKAQAELARLKQMRARWEAVAPSSSGYASLEYGRDEHPCYELDDCRSCVHRLRFDNSASAAAVLVELFEVERRPPGEASGADRAAELQNELNELKAEHGEYTGANLRGNEHEHRDLAVKEEIANKELEPLKKVVQGQLPLTHARFLTGVETRPTAALQAGAVIHYEVRVRVPGPTPVYVSPVAENVELKPQTKVLFLQDDQLVDGRVQRCVHKRRFELQLLDKDGAVPSSGGGDKASSTKEMDLNGMNYCEQRFGSAREFEAARLEHCQQLASSLELVEDAITGKKLKIREQLLYIDLNMTSSAKTKAAPAGSAKAARANWDDLGQAKDIAHRMLASTARSRHLIDPPPILICAGPGTGKTWSALQLAHELAALSNSHDPASKFGAFKPVPLLMFVQRLSRHVRNAQQQGRPTGKDDLLRLYIEKEYETDPRRERLLKQAVALRSLVIVIDGVDEASGLEQLIEDFVLQTLVPGGFRLVVTSRPTGIRRAKYEGTFTIFDLKPLTDDQMRQVIKMQCQSQFFEHLLAFTHIRTGHDVIFEGWPDAPRREIQELALPNRFRLNSGRRDGEMRQRERTGARFVAALPEGHAPQSHYLRELNSIVTDDVLTKLDAVLSNLDASEKTKEGLGGVDDAGGALRPCFESMETAQAEQGLKHAVKLALLTHKLRRKEREAATGGFFALVTTPTTTMRTLHREVVRRTDEVYLAIEDVPTASGAFSMTDIFKRALEALAKQVAASGEGGELMALSFGDPKDPVRIVEKAADDYALDFADGVEAEACVVDVVRARGICGLPQDLLRTQKMLVDPSGFKWHDAELKITVTLEVIRVKSKFGADQDPTHFRNLLNNLKMTVVCPDGATTRATFAELQLHQRDILRYNDDEHAHDHYNYFRSLLANDYEQDLDKFLERTIVFLQEIQGTPVLLSMLVLLFGDAEDDEKEIKVPANLFELYMLVLTKVATRRLADLRGSNSTAVADMDPSAAVDMLRSVAAASFLTVSEVRGRAEASWRLRREFTSDDVRIALGEEKLKLWAAMSTSLEGVPLVKQIVEAGEDGLVGGQYQFKHLSFAEAFCGQHLVQVATGQHERQLFAIPPLEKRALIQEKLEKGEMEKAAHSQAFTELLKDSDTADPLQMLAESDRAVASFINQVLNKNTIDIGGGKLGTAFAAKSESWDFLRGTQLNHNGLANMRTLLNGNTSIRALQFRLNSVTEPRNSLNPKLQKMELDSVLSGCTALTELAVSIQGNWETHLSDSCLVRDADFAEKVRLDDFGVGALMAFVTGLIQKTPSLKKLSLVATTVSGVAPVFSREELKYALQLDGRNLQLRRERVCKQALAIGEEARWGRKMLDALADSGLESFNGVPLRDIRSAGQPDADCDLRGSGPETGLMLAAALQSSQDLRSLAIRAGSLDIHCAPRDTGEHEDEALAVAAKDPRQPLVRIVTESREAVAKLPRLVPSICSLSTLQSLTLYGNGSVFAFMSQLVSQLRTNTHITKLELQDACVVWCMGVGMANFTRCLVENATLRTLDCSQVNAPPFLLRWRGLCEAAVGSGSLQTFSRKPLDDVRKLLASRPPVDEPLKGGMFGAHIHFHVVPAAAFPPHERPKCPAALPSKRNATALTELLGEARAKSAAHFESKLVKLRADEAPPPHTDDVTLAVLVKAGTHMDVARAGDTVAVLPEGRALEELEELDSVPKREGRVVGRRRKGSTIQYTAGLLRFSTTQTDRSCGTPQRPVVVDCTAPSRYGDLSKLEWEYIVEVAGGQLLRLPKSRVLLTVGTGERSERLEPELSPARALSWLRYEAKQGLERAAAARDGNLERFCFPGPRAYGLERLQPGSWDRYIRWVMPGLRLEAAAPSQPSTNARAFPLAHAVLREDSGGDTPGVGTEPGATAVALTDIQVVVPKTGDVGGRTKGANGEALTVCSVQTNPDELRDAIRTSWPMADGLTHTTLATVELREDNVLGPPGTRPRLKRRDAPGGWGPGWCGWVSGDDYQVWVDAHKPSANEEHSFYFHGGRMKIKLEPRIGRNTHFKLRRNAPIDTSLPASGFAWGLIMPHDVIQRDDPTENQLAIRRQLVGSQEMALKRIAKLEAKRSRTKTMPPAKQRRKKAPIDTTLPESGVCWAELPLDAIQRDEPTEQQLTLAAERQRKWGGPLPPERVRKRRLRALTKRLGRVLVRVGGTSEKAWTAPRVLRDVSGVAPRAAFFRECVVGFGPEDARRAVRRQRIEAELQLEAMAADAVENEWVLWPVKRQWPVPRRWPAFVLARSADARPFAHCERGAGADAVADRGWRSRRGAKRNKTCAYDRREEGAFHLTHRRWVPVGDTIKSRHHRWVPVGDTVKSRLESTKSLSSTLWARVDFVNRGHPFPRAALLAANEALQSQAAAASTHRELGWWYKDHQPPVTMATVAAAKTSGDVRCGVARMAMGEGRPWRRSTHAVPIDVSGVLKAAGRVRRQPGPLQPHTVGGEQLLPRGGVEYWWFAGKSADVRMLPNGWLQEIKWTEWKPSAPGRDEDEDEDKDEDEHKDEEESGDDKAGADRPRVGDFVLSEGLGAPLPRGWGRPLDLAKVLKVSRSQVQVQYKSGRTAWLPHDGVDKVAPIPEEYRVPLPEGFAPAKHPRCTPEHAQKGMFFGVPKLDKGRVAGMPHHAAIRAARPGWWARESGELQPVTGPLADKERELGISDGGYFPQLDGEWAAFRSQLAVETDVTFHDFNNDPPGRFLGMVSHLAYHCIVENAPTLPEGVTLPKPNLALPRQEGGHWFRLPLEAQESSVTTTGMCGWWYNWQPAGKTDVQLSIVARMAMGESERPYWPPTYVLAPMDFTIMPKQFTAVGKTPPVPTGVAVPGKAAAQAQATAITTQREIGCFYHAKPIARSSFCGQRQGVMDGDAGYDGGLPDLYRKYQIHLEIKAAMRSGRLQPPEPLVCRRPSAKQLPAAAPPASEKPGRKKSRRGSKKEPSKKEPSKKKLSSQPSAKKVSQPSAPQQLDGQTPSPPDLVKPAPAGGCCTVS